MVQKNSMANTVFNSEGDLNTTSARSEWLARAVSAQAKELLERDSKVFLHQSLSTPCLNVIKNSSGSTITTVDGHQMLDFHGNYIHNVGFGHPKVVDAIKRQLNQLSFCTRRYTNLPAIELAEFLVAKAPDPISRVLFAPGGSEAISMALKIARMHTGRFKTISLWDSFHGATLDAISVGGEAIFRNQVGPLLSGSEHAPPPNPSECPFQCGQTCSLQCANYIEYMLEKEGDVAAVVAETIRSTPFIPPEAYWKQIREACDRHGALLILDEIPHALGRSGKWFTFEHYGIVPDMVVIGKGLGGGVFPLAAVLAHEVLNDSIAERAIGHFTHEKNPVAAAASLAMLELIEEDFLPKIATKSAWCAQRMNAIKDRFDVVYDTRIIGLMMGIELRDPQSHAKLDRFAEKVMYRCMDLGLNFKLSMGSTINLTPPLSVEFEELEQAFFIIERALSMELKHG